MPLYKILELGKCKLDQLVYSKPLLKGQNVKFRSAARVPDNYQQELTDSDGSDNEYPQLHLACIEGNTNRALELLASGFDVNLQDKKGGTALHYSCVKGNVDLVQKLIELGANCNAQIDVGAIPLHFACKEGYLPIAKILVESQSQIDAQYTSGQTPLHLACFFRHGELVKYMIKVGASLTLQDDDEINALDIINKQFGQGFITEISQLLLEEYISKGGKQDMSKHVQQQLNSLQNYIQECESNDQIQIQDKAEQEDQKQFKNGSM